VALIKYYLFGLKASFGERLAFKVSGTRLLATFCRRITVDPTARLAFATIYPSGSALGIARDEVHEFDV
jgi:hypothetical protein